jgi:hypothetical protein
MELRTDMVAGRALSRRKARLMTAAHLDRRTRGAKRARAIAAELARGWDGITPVQRQMLDRAAMLTRVIPSTGGNTPSPWPPGGRSMKLTTGMGREADESPQARRQLRPRPKPVRIRAPLCQNPW